MDEPTSPPYWSIWKDKNTRVKLIACHISWSIFIIVLYAFLLNVRAYGRDYLEVNTAGKINKHSYIFEDIQVSSCSLVFIALKSSKIWSSFKID